MRIINRKQVQHLSWRINPLYRDMLVLMFELALRINEVTSLLTSDVDLEARTLKVIGKGSKERLLPMNHQAFIILKRNVKMNRCLFVFEKSYSYKFNNRDFRSQVYKAALSCNLLGVHPHTIRHSRATEMINNGKDLWHVKQLLGHSDIRTTAIYLHYSIEGLRKAIA